MPNITIKTIADQLGITHGTVSRALSGDPRVKLETMALVRAKAQELGYTPSRIGRGLRTKQTMTFGMLISEIGDPFLSEVVRGVHDSITPHGYSLFLAATSNREDQEAQRIQHFREQRVDGIMLCLAHLHRPALDLIRAGDVTTVVINSQGETAHPYTVSNDDHRAAATIIEHLVGRGHRRIGYLGNRNGGGTQAARLLGYQRAMRAAGLPIAPGDIYTADSCELSDGVAAAASWLGQPAEQRPSALFCYNDVLAIGMMWACRQYGVRIPADLSIVGFDDIAWATYTAPPLTTFAQPKYALGAEAGKMLLRLVQRSPEPVEPLTLHGELVIRETVRPLAP